MTADTGYAVSGGAGGVGAELDDLDHAVTALRRSAADLRGATADLGWGRSLLQGLDGIALDPGGALQLEGDLVSVAAQLHEVAMATEVLADAVATCVTGYRGAEDAARNAWGTLGAAVGTAAPGGPLLGWLATTAVVPLASLGGGSPGTASPAAGASVDPQVPGTGAVLGPPSGVAPSPPLCRPGLSGLLPSTADPQLTVPPGGLASAPRAGGAVPPPPVAAGSTGAGASVQGEDWMTRLGRWAGPAEQPVVAVLAGVLAGRTGLATAPEPLLVRRAASTGSLLGLGVSTDTVVTPSPVPPAVAHAGPPAGVGDLLRRVDDTASGTPGRIRVERTTHADGSTAVVVHLPGTQTWRAATDVPASTDAILRGVGETSSAYTDAVVKALDQAGVEPGDPVMIDGHSLGGVVAAQMAADPAVRARFDVQAVVTAGSPIAHIDLPADVQSLSLEHLEDLVPKTDGADNPADQSNRVTVTSATPQGRGAHDLSGYAQLGDQVDRSTDPSLVAFREKTRRFFAAPGDTSVVTEVVARRVGP